MDEKTVIIQKEEGQPVLHLFDRSGHIRDVRLQGRQIFGRETSSVHPDIPVNAQIISKRHGEFGVVEGQTFYRDLGSTNGTRINGALCETTRQIFSGDVFSFVPKFMPDAVQTLASLYTSVGSGAYSWEVIPLGNEKEEIHIGREEGDERLAEDSGLSRHHAIFFRSDRGWAVTDCDSTNGVYVNGRRIEKSVLLNAMDIIRIADVIFFFNGEALSMGIPGEDLTASGFTEEDGSEGISLENSQVRISSDIAGMFRDPETGEADTQIPVSPAAAGRGGRNSIKFAGSMGSPRDNRPSGGYIPGAESGPRPGAAPQVQPSPHVPQTPQAMTPRPVGNVPNPAARPGTPYPAQPARPGYPAQNQPPQGGRFGQAPVQGGRFGQPPQGRPAQGGYASGAPVQRLGYRPVPGRRERRLMISIRERNVWSHFRKKTLLKDIDITIRDGELVLVLGGSGAGKTTFINAVMGYEKAEGKISYDNNDLYAQYERMKYLIGYVPQETLMRGTDTVYETILSAAQMKMPSSATAADHARQVDKLLNLLGLVKIQGSLIDKISGGQKKRVSTAIELAGDPELLFLDEPDSGLDPSSATELWEHLRKIADMGKMVIVISHSPDRAAHLFNKILVLAKSPRDDSGHLAFFGSVPEAKQFFQTDTIEAIVKRINLKEEGGVYTITLDVPESDYMGGRIVNPGDWGTDIGFAQVTTGAELIKDLGEDNPDNNIVFAEAGNYTVTWDGTAITITKN